MCRHKGVIDHQRLIERYTKHEWIVTLLPRFRCRACWTRGEASTSFEVHRVER
jgi:hypothetical protein